MTEPPPPLGTSKIRNMALFKTINRAQQWCNQGKYKLGITGIVPCMSSQKCEHEERYPNAQS